MRMLWASVLADINYALPRNHNYYSINIVYIYLSFNTRAHVLHTYMTIDCMGMITRVVVRIKPVRSVCRVCVNVALSIGWDDKKPIRTTIIWRNSVKTENQGGYWWYRRTPKPSESISKQGVFWVIFISRLNCVQGFSTRRLCNVRTSYFVRWTTMLRYSDGEKPNKQTSCQEVLTKTDVRRRRCILSIAQNVYRKCTTISLSMHYWAGYNIFTTITNQNFVLINDTDYGNINLLIIGSSQRDVYDIIKQNLLKIRVGSLGLDVYVTSLLFRGLKS